MSEMELAYTLIMSLPPLYKTIKQTLFMMPNLTIAAASHAIQTEWRRHGTTPNAGILLATAKNPRTLHQRLKGDYNRNAWCDHHERWGHSTKNCLNPGVEDWARPTAHPNPPQARLATNEDNAPFMLIAALTPRTLLSTVNVADIVVDSGATHHMVHNSTLLHDVKHLKKPLNIVIGNGATINAVATGNMKLPKYTLCNVLLVPGIGCCRGHLEP